MVDAERRLRIAPSAVSREIEGEFMILDLHTGDYFGLRGAGVRIWQALAQPCSREELVRTLLAEFDADEARVREDVTALVAELLEKGVVEEV